MPRKIYISFLLSFALLVCSCSLASASSITASPFAPPQFLVSMNETKTITAHITLSSTSPSFVRAAFYAQNTAQYFGCISDSRNQFICDTDTTTQAPTISKSGTYTFTVKPDYESPLLTGSGSYTFALLLCTDQDCSTRSSTQLVEITQDTEGGVTAPPQTHAPTTPGSSQLSLSEVMICPNAGTQQWVEIYNADSSEANLQNWVIQDTSASNKQAFSLLIPAKGYGIISLDTQIFKPSSPDRVKLLDSNGKTIDEFSYTSCIPNQTWAYFTNGWQQTSSITKGGPNQLSTQTESAGKSDTNVQQQIATQSVQHNNQSSDSSKQKRKNPPKLLPHLPEIVYVALIAGTGFIILSFIGLACSLVGKKKRK